MIRGIYPTRFGQLHLRSNDGKGVPLLLLHTTPRSGAMWEELQAALERPTHAPDRLGYGFSDAPPRALSLEQYAQATVDGLKAAGMQGQVDLLGMHVGAIEALEVAQLLGSQVRRVALVGMPLFTLEEQQRQLEKYSEQPLQPASEGGHVLGAWRGSFAYRQPPFDLSDAHRRFVEHVLAANPGAALRAACGYPVERALRALRAACGYPVERALRALQTPLTVFAPHDELIEQTMRIRAMLRPDATYVDLPDLGMDIFGPHAARMAGLLNEHLPP